MKTVSQSGAAILRIAYAKYSFNGKSVPQAEKCG